MPNSGKQNWILGTLFGEVATSIIKVRFRKMKYLVKVTELVSEREGFAFWSIQIQNWNQGDLGLNSAPVTHWLWSWGWFLNFSKVGLHSNIFKNGESAYLPYPPKVKYLRQDMLMGSLPSVTYLEWALSWGPKLAAAEDNHWILSSHSVGDTVGDRRQ